MDGAQSQQSIVGTPLYQSPQVLKRKCYNDTVDTWALGVMLFELLVGVTPFHCFELRDLVRKINDGRYKLSVQDLGSIGPRHLLSAVFWAVQGQRGQRI